MTDMEALGLVVATTGLLFGIGVAARAAWKWAQFGRQEEAQDMASVMWGSEMKTLEQEARAAVERGMGQRDANGDILMPQSLTPPETVAQGETARVKALREKIEALTRPVTVENSLALALPQGIVIDSPLEAEAQPHCGVSVADLERWLEALQAGALTINELRQHFGLPAKAGGDAALAVRQQETAKVEWEARVPPKSGPFASEVEARAEAVLSRLTDTLWAGQHVWASAGRWEQARGQLADALRAAAAPAPAPAAQWEPDPAAWERVQLGALGLVHRVVDDVRCGKVLGNTLNQRSWADCVANFVLGERARALAEATPRAAGLAAENEQLKCEVERVREDRDFTRRTAEKVRDEVIAALGNWRRQGEDMVKDVQRLAKNCDMRGEEVARLSTALSSERDLRRDSDAKYAQEVREVLGEWYDEQKSYPNLFKMLLGAIETGKESLAAEHRRAEDYRLSWEECRKRLEAASEVTAAARRALAGFDDASLTLDGCIEKMVAAAKVGVLEAACWQEVDDSCEFVYLRLDKGKRQWQQYRGKDGYIPIPGFRAVLLREGCRPAINHPSPVAKPPEAEKKTPSGVQHFHIEQALLLHHVNYLEGVVRMLVTYPSKTAPVWIAWTPATGGRAEAAAESLTVARPTLDGVSPLTQVMGKPSWVAEFSAPVVIPQVKPAPAPKVDPAADLLGRLDALERSLMETLGSVEMQDRHIAAGELLRCLELRARVTGQAR